MGGKRKGMSLDQKKEVIKKLFQETGQVYNMKEIEKLGA